MLKPRGNSRQYQRDLVARAYIFYGVYMQNSVDVVRNLPQHKLCDLKAPFFCLHTFRVRRKKKQFTFRRDKK